MTTTGLEFKGLFWLIELKCTKVKRLHTRFDSSAQQCHKDLLCSIPPV